MPNTLQQSNRIGYIDILRGISILWVVIYHFEVLPNWVNVPYRMPLFFFMSGIFFRERGSFRDFLCKKLNTLIVPFILYFILGWCFNLMQMGYIYFSGKEVMFLEAICRPLKLFTLLPVGTDISNPVGVGAIWFLIGIFNIQLLYYFVRKISCNKYFLLSVSLILFFVGHCLNTIFAMGSIWYWIFSLQFVIYYVAGHIFGPELTKILKNRKYESLLAIIAVLVYYLQTLISDDNLYLYQFKILVQIFSLISVLFIIVKNVEHIKVLNIIKFYGQNSIVLLGTHLIFILIYNHFFRKIMETETVYLHWMHLILFLFILGASYCIIKFFNKYLPAFAGKAEIIKCGFRKPKNE